MNPLISLFLIALAVLGAIVVLALVCSVVLIAAGKRYTRQQFELLKNQIAQLLPDGDASLAEKLLDGQLQLEECMSVPEEKAAKIRQILDAYRKEQEQIRKTAEEHQKKRPQKGRVLKFLTEKKDRGEWI